ncbi:ABC transporter permease [Oleiphilus sp. HI0071]|jgi:ABC-2 type transport system permease protein|uniref:ABC transporter permease n=1 Tax=unclassified Oleiphilus TaxID=2631174 RepID=UPI0007C21615|nr:MULTISPECIES: ABC transporter permease subunit [unclassified Oleiphilus]KZY72438.1 ABC transporter permease [Oleiphilus sp. HI0065]KZY83721.1 ABC transporter permease [Oleiphilus sp. HI0071]KZZ04708.1 ABC transporter permease [Oleiphilus sp. HI0073]KZZ44978.1 ABC transporter permease [Oleiphilus sp. HI0118]KZZ52718.1 ABC transporter permease [Oleiphilus sp. HI0122]KZZ71769.1 ABC transporter permease [Oleiphilus sp. HI0130]KZZ81136.1 ABC transporter permease [Oleiphilus sp. HI0133]
MSALKVILGRELASYFATPVAYIFIIIFLMLSGVFTFYIGQFFERGQADLSAFFNFVPWLYLVLIPSVAMRLWSEERRSGTIELIMTLPVATWQLVLGKFLAAWLFVGLALALTFPLWITVNYLGAPDNGVILGAYLGAWLMAGGFLAVGSCLSALSKNQIIAFILTLVVCFVLVVSGFPIVQDSFSGWAPLWLVDGISNLSFLTHFTAISRGVIDLRDLVYFVAMIGAWLYATALVIDLKKAD